MIAKRICIICSFLIAYLVLLTSCSQPSNLKVATPTSRVASPTPSPTITGTATPDLTPVHFMTRTILSGRGRPDDLVFDPQGRLLFSDFYNGTISRINTDGSVTVMLKGIAGPEGMVYLSDGTLIIAEQRTNRILELAPGESSLTVLRTLPGFPGGPPCKDGVDNIALDPTSNTLIIPDSPIGNVYRMSLDGKTLTVLASGIVRPVGAAIDNQGAIYVADECGGAIVRIMPGGKITRITGFAKPDDVAFDQHGNMLVIDLLPSIHALIRVRLTTGKHETLLSKGFIEPQGLVVDKNDNIYVSDDFANIIVELIPA